MLSSTTRRTTTSLLRPSSSALVSRSDILLNASNNNTNGTLQLSQRRTLLGLVHAIDKRVYRWAKGVLPPISKTENIALGCGTIGEFRYYVFVLWCISCVYSLNVDWFVCWLQLFVWSSLIIIALMIHSSTSIHSLFQDSTVTSSPEIHPSNT